MKQVLSLPLFKYMHVMLIAVNCSAKSSDPRPTYHVSQVMWAYITHIWVYLTFSHYFGP